MYVYIKMIGLVMYVHYLHADSVNAASGMQELETQVASCGALSESENICTSAMDLHSVSTFRIDNSMYQYFRSSSCKV